ncbi:Ubiquitin-like modifier-activating enzyme [Heracleum sosnowskyi]|uniref:Ubiquitin-like modifier-activating enzyme n=1 Tax=Heracleum sosnowskyi TaxID=360622 RepID=A0AAD8HSM8_9APIA|nr:Ubiquitin-like modifier-activating enzyme [Heracleum sosnowskyi]
MGKKRKSVATSLDEVDRSMYSTFCNGANAISQLYSQAMNHQKLSFQSGERHALEKLYQWILRQQEGGSRVTTADILSYIQADLDYCGEEPSLSPRAPLQNHQLQAASSGLSGGPTAGQVFRSEHNDQQPKSYVFSNALSSPVRRSLQNYHISQGEFDPNGVQHPTTGTRNNRPNSAQLQNSNSNDSSMDMHSDSPGHESTF